MIVWRNRRISFSLSQGSDEINVSVYFRIFLIISGVVAVCGK